MVYKDELGGRNTRLEDKLSSLNLYAVIWYNLNKQKVMDSPSIAICMSGRILLLYC